MNSKKVVAIFSKLQEENPHPTTELIYNTPFELLISVMLSAQATDISVNKATPLLFEKANTPEKILLLGEMELKKYINKIGLFNTKARHIIKACLILIEQYESRVPDTREALESLPGVGRKTANVILNTCFGQPVMAVDTHIFRVANRLGLANGKTPLAVEKQLIAIIPDEFKQDAHHWLILHGRYTCIARKPRCSECILKEWCTLYEKNNTL